MCPACARVTAHSSAHHAPPARHQLRPHRAPALLGLEGPLEVFWSNPLLTACPLPDLWGALLSLSSNLPKRRLSPEVSWHLGMGSSTGQSRQHPVKRDRDVLTWLQRSWGSLVEKRHYHQSQQQGGTAERRGAASLSPPLLLSGRCPWCWEGPNLGPRKPNPSVSHTWGRGGCAGLSARRGAGGSLCDKPDQHGGWQ